MLSFANATGNFCNRIGKLGVILKNSYAQQQTQYAAFTNVATGIVAQFNSESDIQAQVGSGYLGTLNSIGSNTGSFMQQVAAATLNRMVYRDNPQPGQTLTTQNIPASLSELIRQMKLQGASVLAATIGATPSGITGVGNGVLNVSSIRPLDGRVLENIYQETIFFTCTSDSYSNTATADNESIGVSGTGAATSVFDFRWPLGSGASTSISAIDGNTNTGSGNILTNSGFETWSNGLPTNFVFALGGSLVSKETGIIYDGMYSLALTGDGSTLVQWTQPFGSTTGTSRTLSPSTQYGFCMWLRRDAIAAGSGQLTIDLVDGGSNRIYDNSGSLTSNTSSINLTALTTVYAAYLIQFRTPTILPSSQSLRFRLTSTLTSGRTVYMDKASLGIMTQAYTSGPFFSFHAGSTPLAINDYATCVMTNSRGSGGTLSTFQTLFAQLFPLVLNSEYLIPSSNTPTISDTLIG